LLSTINILLVLGIELEFSHIIGVSAGTAMVCFFVSKKGTTFYVLKIIESK
jgi:hypothetical protein